MMEKQKISIIVPVYKCESSLQKCVDSILAQSYSNIEIILIDDGSPDSSGIICDEFANEHNHLITIHKSNGGVSSARNAGLDIATGDYIGFVDSDDTIEPNMYETLLNALIESRSDMAVCGYKDVYNTVTKKIQVENSIYTVKDFLELALSDFRMYRTMRGPWNRLISRRVLDSTEYGLENLRFPSYISYGEDTAFVSDVLARCNTVTFVKGCLYKHFIFEKSSSICADTVSDKNLNDAMLSNNHLCRNFIKILPEKADKIREVFELQNLLAKRDGKATAALRNNRFVNKAYHLSFKDLARILKLSDNKITTMNTLLIFFTPMKLYKLINRVVLCISRT